MCYVKSSSNLKMFNQIPRVVPIKVTFIENKRSTEITNNSDFAIAYRFMGI